MPRAVPLVGPRARALGLPRRLPLIWEVGEDRGHVARGTGTRCMQAHCEQGQTAASWGQKAQQPQDDASSGHTQTALAAVPQHGAPIPQVLQSL